MSVAAGGPTVPFLDVAGITARHRAATYLAISRVMDSGWFVLGRECADFERAWAGYCGTRHAVGVANGLDAMWLLLKASGFATGNEVLVPSNTYIATALAVSNAGLTPVLVEPDPATFNIDPDRVEAAITPRTVAIMAVHLYGRCAPMARLRDIAARRGLKLFEDCAQGHGAREMNGTSRTGSLGDGGAFSFYPGKNLGCFGDGGAVTTDDDDLAARVRELANYGSARKYENRVKGVNSRLDEMQAAVLSAKLPLLDEDNARRRAVAARYRAGLANGAVAMPADSDHSEGHVHHLFVVRAADRPRRDALAAHLAAAGVQTVIHYPIAIHRQSAYAELGGLSLPVAEAMADTVLSLPMGPTIADGQIDRVIDAVNSFRPESF